MTPPTPRLRADAQANRSLILQAADDVFGEGGESASTEEVARRAGVGIATVFRHFPTKAELLEAVLVARLERLRERAREVARTTAPDRAFFDFFAFMVADAATKIAVSEALIATGAKPAPATLQAAEDLRGAVGELLERAQAAGSVRSDAQLPEVYAVLVGTCRGTAHASDSVRARTLDIVFDGLAPRG